MKPLVYLTIRTFQNSIKRATQSPTRLIGVVVIIASWFMFIIGRVIDRPSAVHNQSDEMPLWNLPAIEVVYALMFAILLIFFLIRAFSMFTVPGSYKPSDADVLFATPVSPRAVMTQRMIMDYLLFLIIPLLVVLFSGPGAARGFDTIVANLPDASAAPWFVKTSLIAFLLVSLFGICLSYAVAMFINRDTDASRLSRKIVVWTFVVLLTLLGSFVIAAVRSDAIGSRLLDLANSPWMRALAYPVAAGSDLAVAPLYGTWLQGLMGASFLVVGSSALLWLALRQSNYLYDMAARKAVASQASSEARKTGDYIASYVDLAKQGKLKVRRVWIVGSWTARGAWAIVWRELILGARGGLALLGLFAALILFLGALMAVMPSKSSATPFFMLGTQGLLILSAAMSIGQAGGLETLRRVDVQKPLPFTSSVMCGMEAIGKGLPCAALSLLPGCFIIIFSSIYWQVGIASLLLLPCIALILVATQLLLLLLFPDVEDPAQRAFRGLMQFLGSLLISSPPIVVALLLGYLVNPIVGGLMGVLTAAVVFVVLIQICGKVYASFNPTE
ncbi:MAG: putative ABC exporter domain-containing protein [Candidatus Nitrosotenuis sp.]